MKKTGPDPGRADVAGDAAGAGPRWAGWNRDRVELALLAGFIALATLLRGYLHFTSVIDADEFQTLHSAWLVATGHVPYRDFIGMHSPLLWYLLAPLAGALGDHPTLCLQLARSICFALSLGIVWFCFALARRYWGPRAGLWTAAAASCWPSLAIGAAQVTTVVPMTFFTLGALYVLAREPAGEAPRRGPLGLAGALAALALLSKQSPAAPAAAALFLLAGALAGGGDGARTRLRTLIARVAWFGLGFMAVLGPACAALSLSGAMPGFLSYVFLWHFSQWFPLSPWRQLLAAAAMAPVQTAAAAWGLVETGAGGTREPAGRWGLPAAFLCLLASFCVLLRPTYTHLVPVLALASVLAGPALARASDSLAASLGRWVARVLGCLALLTMVAGLMGNAGGARSDGLQLRQAEYVQSITGPNTPVFAGYPVAFARPHAYPQWFVPPVSLMFYEEIQHMPGTLERNRVPVVVWDALLQGLVDRPLEKTMRAYGLDPQAEPGTERVQAVHAAQGQLRRFVAEHYVPSAVPQVLVCGVRLRPEDTPGGTEDIELLAGGLYRLEMEGRGLVTLDGRPVESGVRVAPGWHTLRVAGDWRGMKLTYAGS